MVLPLHHLLPLHGCALAQESHDGDKFVSLTSVYGLMGVAMFVQLSEETCWDSSLDISTERQVTCQESDAAIRLAASFCITLSDGLCYHLTNECHKLYHDLTTKFITSYFN